MSSEKLTYLPLGGAGEIGMNMYLYGYGPVGDQRFILVDVGVTFPNMETSPGVDLIMADPGFIAERADRLEAIFITHAHEDHVGALGILMPQLQAPVYARKFTAAIALDKLERTGAYQNMINEVEPWPHMVRAGPFQVGFVPISHSIPETSGLAIDTPAGRIFHTADFKIDHTPLVGEAFDEEVMREVAKPGIKALVCDSTNVFSPHKGRSEAELVGPLNALMKTTKGMVVATTFASNVARLKTLAQAAHDQGRSVAVMGRAMNTMIQNGFSTGVLENFPPIVDDEDVDKVPRDNLFVLATGSQGERRAATAQMANGSYRGLDLRAGDTMLFSSKTIPGNETGVARILNQLSELGVRVIEGDDRYHVSGHANAPDLEAMHALMKPSNVIPMHGEHRHLVAHADLARQGGYHAVVAPNGAIVDLTGETAEVIDNIETGRTYLDGSELIGALDGIVRERIRMALRGLAVISVMLESDGSLIDGVWIELMGLPETGRDGDLVTRLEQALEEEIEGAAPRVVADDEALERLVRRVCNTECNEQIGKKPQVVVLINRFE